MNPAPGLICQTGAWRPGIGLDLASNGQELVMEHRVCGRECAICGRGVEFSTGLSATLPDFSSSVFIALTGFPHRVFLFLARWKGLSNRLHRETSPCHRACPARDRLDFASWLVCPECSPFTVRGTNFVELCNILDTAGPATFRPLTAALDSSHFMQGGERFFSLFIELCNNFYRANYFHPGTNAVLSHGSWDS